MAKMGGSVRKIVRDAVVMKIKHPGINAVLEKLDQSSDHSSLFHWMVEHHDAMLARANDGRVRWTDLCVVFAQLGLTTRDGQCPNERNARQTWYRVRKSVARTRALLARQTALGLAPRSLMPSASPRARTPIETTRTSPGFAPTPSAASSMPMPNTGSDAPTRVGGQISDEEVQARMARLRRTLEESSGR